MCKSKEISKFLAGFLFEGLFGHIWLAYSGLLPMDFWGITVTPSLNTFGIVFHSVGTILLVYYGWFTNQKKDVC